MLKCEKVEVTYPVEKLENSLKFFLMDANLSDTTQVHDDTDFKIILQIAKILTYLKKSKLYSNFSTNNTERQKKFEKYIELKYGIDSTVQKKLTTIWHYYHTLKEDVCFPYGASIDSIYLEAQKTDGLLPVEGMVYYRILETDTERVKMIEDILDDMTPEGMIEYYSQLQSIIKAKIKDTECKLLSTK